MEVSGLAKSASHVMPCYMKVNNNSGRHCEPIVEVGWPHVCTSR